MTNSKVSKVKVGSVGTKEEIKEDLLVVEEPLEIRLNYGETDDRKEKSVSVTMRTPGNDFELAIGFLFTEGIIKNYQEIEKIAYCETVKNTERGNVLRVHLSSSVEVDIDRLQRHFYTSSSCGVCGKSSIEAVGMQCDLDVIQDGAKFSETLIHQLSEKMIGHQTVFKYTGGIHAAALVDNAGRVWYVREDIGRHNAVDKLIGAAMADTRIPLNDYILFVSGRAGFELIQKAIMARIGVFAAVGAPSSLAVALAKEHEMTLLGFVRNERFNIYSSKERILLNA